MRDSCSLSDHFSYSEWKSNRMNVMVSAELDRSSAERLSEETKRYLNELKQSYQEMDKMSKWTMQRVKEEVRYWQSELSAKLEQVKLCISDLVSIDRRIDKGLDVVRENSHIIQSCIDARCKRQKIYLAYDPPAKSLCKEKETIEAILAQFCKLKSEGNDHLRMLRKIRYDIEKDLLEKISAWDVEMENDEIERRKQEIENKTFDPQCEGQNCCKQNVRPLLETDVWLHRAKRVFTEAEKQRQNSTTLSSVSNAAIQQAKEELVNIKIATDDAFKERINELRDHKYRMEDHLNKLVKQIQEVEALSQQLIDQIEAFDKRTQYDKCKMKNISTVPGSDGPQASTFNTLIGEQNKMADSIEKLKDNLACLQCSLQSLQRRKVEVETDLALCSENLLIDDYQCLPKRQNIRYFIY